MVGKALGEQNLKEQSRGASPQKREFKEAPGSTTPPSAQGLPGNAQVPPGPDAVQGGPLRPTALDSVPGPRTGDVFGWVDRLG